MRSAWSRHGTIVQIGDVSEEEALQYLKLRKIDDQLAAQVYSLVGGHVADLAAAAWRIETYNDTVQGTFIVCL